MPSADAVTFKVHSHSHWAAGVAVIICSQKFACGCVRIRSAVVAVLRRCSVSDWRCESAVSRRRPLETSLPRVPRRCCGRQWRSCHTDGRIGQGPARRRKSLCRQTDRQTDDEARSVDGPHVGSTAQCTRHTRRRRASSPGPGCTEAGSKIARGHGFVAASRCRGVACALTAARQRRARARDGDII